MAIETTLKAFKAGGAPPRLQAQGKALAIAVSSQARIRASLEAIIAQVKNGEFGTRARVDSVKFREETYFKAPINNNAYCLVDDITIQQICVVNHYKIDRILKDLDNDIQQWQ